MRIKEETRHAMGGDYVPVKGGVTRPEFFQSNLNSLIKMDMNGQKVHNEYVSSFRKKNVKHTQSTICLSSAVTPFES